MSYSDVSQIADPGARAAARDAQVPRYYPSNWREYPVALADAAAAALYDQEQTLEITWVEELKAWFPTQAEDTWH